MDDCTLATAPRDVLGEILLGPMACSAMAQRHVWPPYDFLHDLQNHTQDETVDEARMVLVVVARSVCREWRDVVQGGVLGKCCAPLDFFSDRCIKAGATDVHHWAARQGCPKGSWQCAMRHGRFDLVEQQWPPYGIKWQGTQEFINLMAQVYTVECAERMHRWAYRCFDCVDELDRNALYDLMCAATRTANYAMLRWVADRPNCGRHDQGTLVQLAARTGNIELFEYIQWLCTKDGTTPWELDDNITLQGHVWRFAMMSGNVEFIRYILQRYPMEQAAGIVPHHINPLETARMPMETLEFIQANLQTLSPDVGSAVFVDELLNYNMAAEPRAKYRHRLDRIHQWIVRSGLVIPSTHNFLSMLHDSEEEARKLYPTRDIAFAPTMRDMILMQSWNVLEYVTRERAKHEHQQMEFWACDLASDAVGGSAKLCQRLLDAGAEFRLGIRPVPRYAAHDLVVWLQQQQAPGGGVCKQLVHEMTRVCGSRLLGAQIGKK